jgi:hypothetical protein
MYPFRASPSQRPGDGMIRNRHKSTRRQKQFLARLNEASYVRVLPLFEVSAVPPQWQLYTAASLHRGKFEGSLRLS